MWLRTFLTQYPHFGTLCRCLRGASLPGMHMLCLQPIWFGARILLHACRGTLALHTCKRSRLEGLTTLPAWSALPRNFPPCPRPTCALVDCFQVFRDKHCREHCRVLYWLQRVFLPRQRHVLVSHVFRVCMQVCLECLCLPVADCLWFADCWKSFCRVEDYWHGYKLFCYAYYSNSEAHESEFRNSKLGA